MVVKQATWRQNVLRAQTARLVLVPSFLGALTGAAAIAFVKLIDLVQWLAIGSTQWPLHVLPYLAWYHVLLVPALGGLVVGPLVCKAAPEAEGHGVPEVIETVMARGGRMRSRVAVVKTLASAVTIGTGGSVGREGPVVQIGAAIGSGLGQLLRLPSEQLKTLAACGTAGGIAAIFNAPIAGAFFALEVITRDFAMRSFSPVILSSVLATVVSRAWFGDHPAFTVQPFELASALEMPLYAVLGLLCGTVGAWFVWTMDRFESWTAKLPVPKMWRPGLGGLVLGGMVLLLPNLYGVGYATMDAALSGALPWRLLAVLVPMKILATSLTIASGGSGGVFLPSLYMGAMAGGLYGMGVQALLPGVSAHSGAYALIGMSGVLAAATHSPITAMILLIEITGDYRVVLPAMLVVTLASLVGRALKEDSLYTLKLARKSDAVWRQEDVILRTHTVGRVMKPAVHAVREDTPIPTILRYFLNHEVAFLYVTDSGGKLLGAISIHDIKDPEIRDLGSLVLAADVAESNLPRMSPEDTLADCMDQFAASEQDELPVVFHDGTLAGVVTRRDVLRVFNSELLRHVFLDVSVRDRSAGAIRESLRLGEGLTLARVETPAWLVGRSLRQADLRAAYRLTVVAIRRPEDDEDRLPDPAEPLRQGDILVVVGRSEDIERFRAAGRDEGI